MSSIEVGSVATAVIGVLWAVLAVLTPAGNTGHDVIVGAVIATSGIATAIAARWREW